MFTAILNLVQQFQRNSVLAPNFFLELFIIYWIFSFKKKQKTYYELIFGLIPFYLILDVIHFRSFNGI